MKKIAIVFNIFYVLLSLLITIGDRDDRGFFKMLFIVTVLWAGYFFLKKKNLKYKEIIFTAGLLVLPFTVFSSWLLGFFEIY